MFYVLDWDLMCWTGFDVLDWDLMGYAPQTLIPTPQAAKTGVWEMITVIGYPPLLRPTVQQYRWVM